MSATARLQAISKLPKEQQADLLALCEELEEAERVEKARSSFLLFVKELWPGFIEGNHHRIMAAAYDRILRKEAKRLIINMPPRHQLLVSTQVFTTNGWKTMGSIVPGDYVFGVDGKPVEVVGKSPISHKRIYEVETSDGHIVRCDADHLWTYSARTERQDRRWQTRGTAEILEKDYRHGPYLPDHQAIQMPDSDLPIDPYVLGVWLGDGTKYGASVGCATRDEPEVRRLIEECGYKTSDRDGYQMFGVLGLHAQLRENGLLENKHIPEQYLCASEEQRIALMQGLMDTDGSIGKTGRATFHQTDESLVRQFCSLVNSLGTKARVTKRQTSYNGKPSQPSYRVNFRHPKAARMPRKADRLGDGHAMPGRSIKIRKTNEFGDVQCLQVASEDGLFLAGEGFVVTHNTKSEFSSIYLVAMYLGMYPDGKIIQASNTAELAVGFGRKVRNLIATKAYQKIFPGVKLSADAKAAGRWTTSAGGEYFAIGVGGTVSGRGADLFVIDDPHSEQEGKAAETDPTIFDPAYEWYTSGPRQRLQPGGAMVIPMTRWGMRDLTGRIMAKAVKRDSADSWELIEFPMELPSGKVLWPEFWPQEEMEALKAELPASKWNAQYQQKPTSEEGALVKREWWKIWKQTEPPVCDYVIQSWDTAFLKTQRADYNACTTWGVFYRANEDDRMVANIILLDSFQKRMEFPELKKAALEAYMERQPDCLVIEGKASGMPLLFELRQMGIPVVDYTPHRGTRANPNDKIARVNAISTLFESGFVWCPDTKWAEELREQFAAFPAGGLHDDLVDSATIALSRFREGRFIRINDDYEDKPLRKKRAAYY